MEVERSVRVEPWGSVKVYGLPWWVRVMLRGFSEGDELVSAILKTEVYFLCFLVDEVIDRVRSESRRMIYSLLFRLGGH